MDAAHGSDVAAFPCSQFLQEEVPVGGHGIWLGGSVSGMVGAGGCLLPSGSTPDLCVPLPLQSRLHQNCSEQIKPINDTHSLNDTMWCSWAPFGKHRARCSSHSPFPLPREGAVQGGLPAGASMQSAFYSSHLLSDKDNYKELLAGVDNAFLVAYAIGMFIR